MLKNNKAVTLISLVITIVVISILASITITTTDSLIVDTRLKTVVANMYLVKGKAETIYDEYNFSEDKNLLIGEEYTDDVLKYGANVTSNDLWYIWNSSILNSIGLDSNMLSGNATFIVNYATGEVIYTPGCKTEDGNIVYTLTDMTE